MLWFDAKVFDDVLLIEGNCITAAIFFAKADPGNIAALLQKKNQSNKTAVETGRRAYRDCQTLCKCKLRPTKYHDLVLGRSYILHSENGGTPKAVRFTLVQDSSFLMTDRGRTWKGSYADLVKDFPKANDFKSLVFFEVLPHGTKVSLHSYDDILLDLVAGGDGEEEYGEKPAQRFLDALEKDVENYKTELKATKYRKRRSIGVKATASKKSKVKVIKVMKRRGGKQKRNVSPLS